jgi:hypothetical protein
VPDLPPVDPSRYHTFYHLRVFTRRWEALGLTEDDLVRLMAELMADPEAGVVPPETPSLRKVRFAPPSRRQAGRSGSVRVYYAHLPELGVIVLAVAFDKSETADIGRDQRRELAKAVDALAAALREDRRKRRRKT